MLPSKASPTNDECAAERPVPVSSASSLDTFDLAVSLPPVSVPVSVEDINANQAQSASSNAGVPKLAWLPSSQPKLQSTSFVPSPFGRISYPASPNPPDPCASTTMQPSMQSTLMAGNMLFPGAPSGGNSVPEFLFQLTKMLTEDNREVIEWSNGLIKVHNPQKLESQVLHKYFRHSKFSSFQRQLNYFGFRKLAGKGKMAPCSYANESAGQDISSLLFIKRKSSTTTSANKAALKKEGKTRPAFVSSPKSVNPVLAGILHRSSQAPPALAPKSSTSQKALAQSAVGRGIRHCFVAAPRMATEATPTEATTSSPGGITKESLSLPDPLLPAENPLSQLATNFRNSLCDLRGAGGITDDVPSSAAMGGFLSRNSSLIDLAMIPMMEDTNENGDDGQTPVESALTATAQESAGWNFVDFPYPEVCPAPVAAATSPPQQDEKHALKQASG